MLNFNPDTGFEVSEVADIRQEIAEIWKQAFREKNTPELNTEPETPQGQIIDAQTLAVSQKDAELSFLASMFNPKTAEGIWQDALAQVYFLERKKAVASSANCAISGLSGTLIEKGAQIQSTVDGTLWTLSESVTIPSSGTAIGRFVCQTVGAVQASAGTLTKIITTVAGWDSVNNSADALIGQLEETKQAFENRRYQSVALNSRSTNESVFARVAQIADVLAVKVASNRTNQSAQIDGYQVKPHSVLVSVLGGADDEIAEAIYKSVSAGCDFSGDTEVFVKDEFSAGQQKVSFLRPDALDVFVKVNVYNFDLPNNYEQIIKQAIINNALGLDEQVQISGEYLLRIGMGEDIYSSRFLPSILNQKIKTLLSVQIGLSSEELGDFVHIPIDKYPNFNPDNIVINLINVEA